MHGAGKSDNLNSILGTYMVEGENGLAQVVLRLLHSHHGIGDHTHTHIYPQ